MRKKKKKLHRFTIFREKGLRIEELKNKQFLCVVENMLISLYFLRYKRERFPLHLVDHHYKYHYHYHC